MQSGKITTLLGFEPQSPLMSAENTRKGFNITMQIVGVEIANIGTPQSSTVQPIGTYIILVYKCIQHVITYYVKYVKGDCIYVHNFSYLSLSLLCYISVSLFLISCIVTIFLLSFYCQYVSHHIFNLLLFLFLSLSILSSYSSSTAVSLTHFLHSLLATSYFFFTKWSM